MAETYKRSIETIDKYKNHKYYAFYRKHFEICYQKACLYRDLRNKYKEDDKEYLANVADEVIPGLIRLYKEFYKIFRELSFESNKRNGFERVHIRFGGIIMRLEYAAEVLNDYANGRISVLEELENEPVSGINKTWCSPEQHFSVAY